MDRRNAASRYGQTVYLPESKDSRAVPLRRRRLNDAVGRAAKRTESANALFDLVQEQNDTIDEQAFVDDVTRNLRSGRFLLLVVGDGIREGVERIADYLKQSAGIRFTFGLVELAMFDMPDETAGGIIVEPRVLARTYEIERAVVRVADAGVVVEDPPTTGPPSRDGGGRRKPITVGEFYEWRSCVSAKFIWWPYSWRCVRQIPLAVTDDRQTGTGGQARAATFVLSPSSIRSPGAIREHRCTMMLRPACYPSTGMRPQSAGPGVQGRAGPCRPELRP